MATKTNAGMLDRTVDILEKASIRNELGEVAATYDPFLSGLPARKEERSGEESPTESGRDTATDSVLFTLRYRDDITPTHRLRCEGVDYDIDSVREGEGRRQWTVITGKRRN